MKKRLDIGARWTAGVVVLLASLTLLAPPAAADSHCNRNLVCAAVQTCVGGQLYPSACGPHNCDQPIGSCGGTEGGAGDGSSVPPQVFTLDFPHFANGGGISSEVVLLNVGTTPVLPVLYFSDRQGKPIDADSVVEVTDDLEVTDDGGLTIQAMIEPLGELTVATHGRGEEVSGSVRVVAEGAPLGGVLRYSVPGVGVTGVGTGQPMRDALFPARRRQVGIRTAAALHNPGEEAIELTCRLMRGGEVLEEAEIPLAAKGQTSWFIEETFTETDTTDFVGTVRCTAPREGMFTGLAVEVDAGNRIFTTLPVAAVERRAGQGGGTVLHFAHFANGGGADEEGIRSELVFVNLQTETSRPAPTAYSDEKNR